MSRSRVTRDRLSPSRRCRPQRARQLRPRSQRFGPEVFDGRPVIGIAMTWSELAPCNARLHRVAEAVKRGAWQAGGFPPEFPVMVTGETLMRPTAMFCRNLLAMEAEELIGPADDGSAAAGRAREYWPGE
jgi:dihydroxyacid dehydratase/phosphogluconate dehydratase